MQFDTHTVIKLVLHVIPLLLQLLEQIMKFLFLTLTFARFKSLFDLTVSLNFLVQFSFPLFLFRQLFEKRGNATSLIADVRLLLAFLDDNILVELLLHLCLPLLKLISSGSILCDASSLHVQLGLLFFSESFEGDLHPSLDLILQVSNYRIWGKHLLCRGS